MSDQSLLALSPVDGRYAQRTQPLQKIFSEYGLIRHRLKVEIAWFQWLSAEPAIQELPPLSEPDALWLNHLAERFSPPDAIRVKALEATTNHDVKAVEYYLKDRLSERPNLAPLTEFIHFACTSEDINNLSYALMMKSAKEEVLLPVIHQLIDKLTERAQEMSGSAMLARTHGQAASPTTMGKEWANFVHRLTRQTEAFSRLNLTAKFNGVVGNYNAHLIAYPNLDWPDLCRRFIASFGLDFNTHTTQIEPHDTVAEYCHNLSRLNRILVDYNQDIWGYIALGYFKQKQIASETGSSTMPHKVNPIDFENSEGNLQLANHLLNFFAHELATSRWQRDLTDSTLLRNLGVALAHSLIAWESCLKGTDKLKLAPDRLAADLEKSWEVLAEAAQTLMRKHGLAVPYEKIKAATRGQSLDKPAWHALIDRLDLPAEARDRLKQLKPADYIGLAQQLASQPKDKGA